MEWVRRVVGGGPENVMADIAEFGAVLKCVLTIFKGWLQTLLLWTF